MDEVVDARLHRCLMTAAGRSVADSPREHAFATVALASGPFLACPFFAVCEDTKLRLCVSCLVSALSI